MRRTKSEEGHKNKLIRRLHGKIWADAGEGYLANLNLSVQLRIIADQTPKDTEEVAEIRARLLEKVGAINTLAQEVIMDMNELWSHDSQ